MKTKTHNNYSYNYRHFLYTFKGFKYVYDCAYGITFVKESMIEFDNGTYLDWDEMSSEELSNAGISKSDISKLYAKHCK